MFNLNNFVVFSLTSAMAGLLALAAKNPSFLESQAFAGTFGGITGGLVGVLVPVSNGDKY